MVVGSSTNIELMIVRKAVQRFTNIEFMVVRKAILSSTSIVLMVVGKAILSSTSIKFYVGKEISIDLVENDLSADQQVQLYELMKETTKPAPQFSNIKDSKTFITTDD